jgi:hypothetical protein
MTIKQILMGTTQVRLQRLTGAWCSLLENVATPRPIEHLRNCVELIGHRSMRMSVVASATSMKRRT